MKRLLLLFIITTLSASVLTGCRSKKDLQTIADLQAQFEEYSTIKSEWESLKKSISDLQSQIDSIIAENKAMFAKLEALYAIEPMDETMYTIAEAKLYADIFDEALGNEAVGTLQAGQEVKVIGKSKVTGCYVIEIDGAKRMIHYSLVSKEKPAETQKPAEQQKPAETQKPSQPQQQQPPQAQQPEAEQQAPAQQPQIGDTVPNEGGGDLMYGGDAGI